MKKENFIELLKIDSPNEILDFIKRKGKKKKSVNPIVFKNEDDNK